jgi:hypothetical protein
MLPLMSSVYEQINSDGHYETELRSRHTSTLLFQYCRLLVMRKELGQILEKTLWVVGT